MASKGEVRCAKCLKMPSRDVARQYEVEDRVGSVSRASHTTHGFERGPTDVGLPRTRNICPADVESWAAGTAGQIRLGQSRVTPSSLECFKPPGRPSQQGQLEPAVTDDAAIYAPKNYLSKVRRHHICSFR